MVAIDRDEVGCTINSVEVYYGEIGLPLSVVHWFRNPYAGICYDHFFPLNMLGPCSSFLFFFVNSPLSPWTSISTDRFSCANYVVPLTHRFHCILSHSTMTYSFD